MQVKVLVILCGILSCVLAGGPAAYTISAPSIDGAYVGSSHEHTVKGHYGQNSHSVHSNSVDSAHSSVRVSSSRTSNDVLSYAPHYGGHVAAPAYAAHAAYAAPAVAYAAPAVKVAAPAFAAHAYAAPAFAAHSYAAPAIATHSYAAPAYAAHSYVAPAYASHSYASHAYAAPAIAAHSFAAPALKVAAAPALLHGATYGHGYGYGGLGYGHGYGLAGYAPSHHYGTHLTGAALHGGYVAAPAAVKVAAAPAISYAHAAPLAYGHAIAPAYGHGAVAYKTAVAAAPAVVHTSFLGHGAHYAY